MRYSLMAENKTYKVAGVHIGKKGVTVLEGKERKV
jgi:hypothetical protein